jgi:hypothetical protein
MVEALVVVETLLLILVGLLVAGLLRSHAEILRRLESPEPSSASRAPGVSAPARDRAAPASDVAGVTLHGDAVQFAVRTPRTNTLLAFLSSGCTTCKIFWDGLQPAVRREVPGIARVVVVTKDSAFESPSRLRALAPPDVPVVMSSEAWDAYGVPGSPYFVYVDGSSGQVHGEGMAQSWDQVFSLLGDALADADPAITGSMHPTPLTPPEAGPPANGGLVAVTQGPRRPRGARVEDELRSAGIGEGHPSLYTAGHAEPPVSPPENGGSTDRSRKGDGRT